MRRLARVARGDCGRWPSPGGSFGTALIPVRAVICIAWMLVVTFGASVMVYQLGYLEGLGVHAPSPLAYRLRAETQTPTPPLCVRHV